MTTARPRRPPGSTTPTVGPPRRILFTAGPFFGHVNPLLPLALAARRAGHAVALATGPDFVDHVTARGVAAWPVGPTAAEAGTPQSLDHFLQTGASRAADLLPLTEAWHPDLVVSEELELGGPIAAARCGARLVVHGLGIAAGGDWGTHAPSIDAVGRRWGVADLTARHTQATLVSICPPTLRPAGESSRPTLALRPTLGESSGAPRLPAAFARLPFATTIHVTLGTVFHRRHPGVLQAALAGLRGIDANVVVTVGPGVDPRELGSQPAHVLVAEYLPHAQLLPHCNLVVSQGGAGVLFGALAHGIPQLVLPQGADQFANAAAITTSGLGLSLDGSAVTPDAIARSARRLLTERGFASAAAAVAEDIAGMPGPDDVLAALTAGAGVSR